MTASRSVAAPCLAIAWMTLGAVAATPAIAAEPAGPPRNPSLMLNGTALQPLSSLLPGGASRDVAVSPVRFTVANAATLPPGITISASGAITGVPAADGTYTASVTACTSQGCTPGYVTFTIAPDQAPCRHRLCIPADQKAYGMRR